MNLPFRKKYEAFCHLGVKLEVPPFLLSKEVHQQIREGRYEVDKISEIIPMLQQGDVVLELGAGIGFTSSKIAQEPMVARVISVENDRRFFAVARRTHELNRVDVTLIDTTIAHWQREPSLVVQSAFSAAGSLESGANPAAFSLPALLTNLRPTVLVVDMESEELSVLQNADVTCVRAIVLKLHPNVIGLRGMSRVFSLLSSHGFSCHSSTESVATFTRHHLASKDEEINLLTKSPFFDAWWYLATYQDVNAAGINPICHYLEFGANEGRNPSALFDTRWYREQNKDVGSINPLVHYLRVGHERGNQPHPFGVFRDKIEYLEAPALQRLIDQFCASQSYEPAPTDDLNCIDNRQRWAKHFVSHGSQAIIRGDILRALKSLKLAVQVCPEYATAWTLYAHAFRTYNSSSFHLFDEIFRQAELLVVHVSCKARIQRALDSARSFDDPSGRIKNLIVVGAEAPEHKFDLDTDSCVLTVPASDAYEDLPMKIYQLLCFFGLSSLMCPILKVDDDVHCRSLSKLFEDLTGKITAWDYGGCVFASPSRLLDCNFWHFGKCCDSDTNRRPDGLFFHPFATGPHYWLSLSCLNLLCRAVVVHERYFSFETYEDRAVGTVLNYYGIRPQHYVLTDSSLKYVS